MKSKLLQDRGEKTYAVVFDKGDEAIAGLRDFAKQKGLAGSHLTAIGGFSTCTLAYFDREKRAYTKIPLPEQVEVLSLVGDITLDGQEPKVHVHVVVGRPDGTTRGGHLMEARVWPTLEVVITESPKHLQRQNDPETGLALIRLDS